MSRYTGKYGGSWGGGGSGSVPSTGPGSGDVVGPSSATDNAIARFDSTTGKLLQNSGVIISDANALGVGAGTPSLPSMSFVGDVNTGFYQSSSGADIIDVALGGTRKFYYYGNEIGYLGTGFALADSGGGTPIKFFRLAAGVGHFQDNSANTGGIVFNPYVVVDADGATLTAADCGKYYTNEGATGEANFVLPSAVAGMSFGFYCQDADGIKATAASGDTIRIAASVSAAAGNVVSTTIGSFVKLVAINATEWVAFSSIGTWVVT